MTGPLEPVNTPAIVWTRFLVAFARLFSLPVREDAAYRAEAFGPWRDRVLAELGSDDWNAAFAMELQALLDDEANSTAAQLMLLELDGFTTYVERLTGSPIAPDVRYPEEELRTFLPPADPNATKESFSVAGTIVDSIRDLLDKLPLQWKALLKAFSELASIWKDFG
jgi:hypothetical protein